MKKISKQISVIILLLSTAWFAQAEHKHAGEVMTPDMIRAQKVANDNATHLGNKGTKYKERHTILVDLKKIEIPESNKNHSYMPQELTIELRDEIYSRLGKELPAGTDFAIWVAQYKKGNDNIASMEIALPKGAHDIDFDGIDFVMSVGPIERTGFYLGDPDREEYYAFRDGWTKKKGLKAIEKKLKSGASADVEAAIFFRDKHDSKLKDNNPYQEVIKHLLDGHANGFPYIDNYTNQVSFELRVRSDQIQYLREHPLVSNVVPNLPLPKSK